MDGDGEFSFAGEGKLGEKDEELFVDVGVLDPAVESAFADGGVGEAVEVGGEEFEPFVRSLVGEPGVESEGGMDEIGVAFGEIGDLGPVGFGGAVDDTAGDADGFHLGDDTVGMGEALEVVVGVDHWRILGSGGEISMSGKIRRISGIGAKISTRSHVGGAPSLREPILRYESPHSCPCSDAFGPRGAGWI